MQTTLGYFRIGMGIFTLGILPAISPNFLHWHAPPEFRSMRTSKQRRSTPVGYPYQPNANEILKKSKDNEIVKRLKGEQQRGSARKYSNHIHRRHTQSTPLLTPTYMLHRVGAGCEESA
jgi:hypothetical protein